MTEENEGAPALDEAGVQDNAAESEQDAQQDEVSAEQGQEGDANAAEQSAADAEQEKAEEQEETPTQRRRRQRKEANARYAQEAAQAKKRAEDAERKLAELQAPSEDLRDQDPDQYTAEYAAQAARRGILEEQKVSATEAADAAHKQAQQAINDEWSAAVNDARTRYTDFDAKVINNPSLPATQDMVDATMATDNPADVAYHLGTHPDEAMAISALPPIQQAIAIGRIEAKLSIPQSNKRTNAPAPVNKVRGGVSTGNINPEDMTPEQYDEWRFKGGGS